MPNSDLKPVLRIILASVDSQAVSDGASVKRKPEPQGELGQKEYIRRLEDARTALIALTTANDATLETAATAGLADLLLDPEFAPGWRATELALTMLFDLSQNENVTRWPRHADTFAKLIETTYHGSHAPSVAARLVQLVRFRHTRDGDHEACTKLLIDFILDDLVEGESLELALARLDQSMRWLCAWSGLLCPALKDASPTLKQHTGVHEPHERVVFAPEHDALINERIRFYARVVLGSARKNKASPSRLAALHTLAYPHPSANADAADYAEVSATWRMQCRTDRIWIDLDLTKLHSCRWEQDTSETESRLDAAERRFAEIFGEAPQQRIQRRGLIPTQIGTTPRPRFAYSSDGSGPRLVTVIWATKEHDYVVNELSHGRWAALFALLMGTGWCGVFGPTLERKSSDHYFQRTPGTVTDVVHYLADYMVPAMYKAAVEHRLEVAAAIAHSLLADDLRHANKNETLRSTLCRIAAECLSSKMGYWIDYTQKPGSECVLDLSETFSNDAQDIISDTNRANRTLEFDWL